MTKEGISCWPNDEELRDHLEEVFTDVTEALREKFIEEHFWVGRSCPFCKVTSVWRRRNAPSLNKQTQRVTVNSPDLVVNGKELF